MEIQVASGVATDLKVLLLAGFVLIGPDTRERRAGGCTLNLGFDTGRGDFACIQRRQTIDQVTVEVICIVGVIVPEHLHSSNEIDPVVQLFGLALRRGAAAVLPRA